METDQTNFIFSIVLILHYSLYGCFTFILTLRRYLGEAFYGRNKEITAVQTNRLGSPDLSILIDLSSSIFSSKGKLGTCKKQSGTNGEQIVASIC
jgi:hypothetical protein